MENFGKNLVSIDKGTNGQSLKKQPISVDQAGCMTFQDGTDGSLNGNNTV
jgi:hypothetical protein